MTTQSITNSINQSPWRRGFLLIPLVLACFALAPTARAVKPPPDGGYANFNTAEGKDALFGLTTGSSNTAIGHLALFFNNTGSNNTATGEESLLANTTGHDNTANGFQALRNNFANEINGAGNYNTASGSQALFLNTIGSGNTATGFHALYSNMTGSGNTANGVRALFSNNNNGNTADGYQALFSNTDGFENTANGNEALNSNQTGTGNTATGASALESNTAGNNNIAIGFLAGSDLTTGDNNIYIGNNGVTTESNTIRIGDPAAQNATFIAGIRDTTTGNDDAIPVVIDSAGQLGTASSSARFKREIKPMDRASEAILGLKPVTFHYKSHKSSATGRPQFGLIAEDVAKVNPDLVVRDADGEIYTVRYDAVNAMLLNEFLKEHRTVQELKSTAAKQEVTIAQQQKQIEALTTGLQKVSDQLGLVKPAPQMVSNNQ